MIKNNQSSFLLQSYSSNWKCTYIRIRTFIFLCSFCLYCPQIFSWLSKLLQLFQLVCYQRIVWWFFIPHSFALSIIVFWFIRFIVILDHFLAIIIVVEIVHYFLFWFFMYFLTWFISPMLALVMFVFWLTFCYLLHYYYPLLSLCLLSLLFRLPPALAFIYWFHSIRQAGFV